MNNTATNQEQSQELAAKEAKLNKTLDKGVVIYFARRHPNNECATNIKVGEVYPPVGENVTVLRFTDKAADTPLAALTPISHDDSADCDVMATIDHANVLKAYGADEMTDDLIEKARYESPCGVMRTSYAGHVGVRYRVTNPHAGL